MMLPNSTKSLWLLDRSRSGSEDASDLVGGDHAAPSLAHDLERIVVGLEAVVD